MPTRNEYMVDLADKIIAVWDGSNGGTANCVKYAEKVSADLDTWLEKNGADFNDPDLMDSTLSGCRIYCEPTGAKVDVEAYIKNKM